MAASLVGGAALGAVFGELLRSVVKASKSAAMFRDTLEEIQFALSSIEPIIKEIQPYNKVFDKEHETNQLLEIFSTGDKLVTKCCKVNRWDIIKKNVYMKKLHRLKRSLERCYLIMQTQQSRDVKEVLFEVKGIGPGIRRLSLNEGSSNGNGSMFCQVGVVLGLSSSSSCNVPEPQGKVVGFDEPLKVLKMKLLNDGVSVIVVSAPGGSGKTTLVKQLCQDEEVKGKFKHNIFYVSVSKKPSLKIILQKLLQAMDHSGALEIQTEEDGMNCLGQKLKHLESNPILLILDDVWSAPLVDKLKFDLPNYKILVTSRFAFRRFDFTYDLKPLNDDNAMTLFRHFAFRQNEEPCIPDDIVNKVMESCKGLPLALHVVARSLCGQDVVMWRKQVKQHAEGISILHSHDDLLAQLQSSLDTLDSQSKIKDCYLDLGSFPEDHRIPASALIDMWVEQYELDEDDAFINLYELAYRNLVNLVVTRKDDASEGDGCYNDHFVMQHDLLRDLAIYQSGLDPVEKRTRIFVELSGNNFPNWWSEEKLQPLGAHLLSISTDETFSCNWGYIQAPEAEVLVLNFRTKNYILPVFMEKMIKLKVLIVMNNGIYPAEVGKFWLLYSLSNLKRIRLEKVSVPSLGTSSLQLGNLRKMSLVMCSISQAFKKGRNKMSDIFPNLLEIDIDYCDDLVELDEGLCDLVQLMKLSITNCHNLRAPPEGIGKLVNLDLLRLTSCTELMTLPETIGSLSRLTILDISNCLSIVNMPARFGELQSLRKLCMRGCSSCELPPTVTKLQHLEDVICDEETAYQWMSFKSYLNNLTVSVHKEDINLNWLQTFL